MRTGNANQTRPPLLSTVAPPTAACDTVSLRFRFTQVCASQRSPTMRSRGLLLGVASLRRPSSSHGTTGNCGRSGDVYLSGFRIVQDAIGTRHCEYRVVIPGVCYERWHRFSEVKALVRSLQSRGNFPDSSKDAWDGVRACKAPKGSALDRGHLSRKCSAIERFLSSLLEEMSVEKLAEGLLQEAASTQRHAQAPRTNSRGPNRPMHLARARLARLTDLETRSR